jgi:hypothetical protein
MGCVEFLGKWEGERERQTNTSKEGKENLLPLPLRISGRIWRAMPFKTTPFCQFFFFMNNA